MTKYHIHHIIPRHAGGTNDPTNLIRLTHAEHAAAHKKLYEENQSPNDYLAWKGLEASINILHVKGYRWYFNPNNGKCFKFLPGEEPTGWMPGMKSKPFKDLEVGKARRISKLIESQPRGSNHHNSKLWTLEDPTGVPITDVVLYSFCKENNLSETALKENFKGSRGLPITKGKSKGWRIISVKEMGRP